MKFNLKDYKLFSKNDVLGFIKHNLNGCVSWKGYTLTSKPDPKFGYSKFELFLSKYLIFVLFFIFTLYVFTAFIYFIEVI